MDPKYYNRNLINQAFNKYKETNNKKYLRALNGKIIQQEKLFPLEDYILKKNNIMDNIEYNENDILQLSLIFPTFQTVSNIKFESIFYLYRF